MDTYRIYSKSDDAAGSRNILKPVAKNLQNDQKVKRKALGDVGNTLLGNIPSTPFTKPIKPSNGKGTVEKKVLSGKKLWPKEKTSCKKKVKAKSPVKEEWPEIETMHIYEEPEDLFEDILPSNERITLEDIKKLREPMLKDTDHTEKYVSPLVPLSLDPVEEVVMPMFELKLSPVFQSKPLDFEDMFGCGTILPVPLP